MTSIASVSQTELTQRRRILRRQRRIKLFQAIWQTLAVSSLAGTLVWAVSQPIWVLRQSNQIVVKGNQYLSDKAIQSLVPLSYPQSLLHIEPETVAHSLESHAPIAHALVTRQLFPPSLKVEVKERVPVALALAPNPKAAVGLLDEKGVWIPLSSYTSSLKRQFQLPTLKVVGLPEQYRLYWAQLYQVVKRSPMKIQEIDCHNPTNLILKTELGMVHLGPYSSRLTQQINVLDQMRQLPSQMNFREIAYIDLKNPDIPSVQMNHAQELVKPHTP